MGVCASVGVGTSVGVGVGATVDGTEDGVFSFGDALGLGVVEPLGEAEGLGTDEDVPDDGFWVGSGVGVLLAGAEPTPGIDVRAPGSDPPV